MATLLISTSTVPIPECLSFWTNVQLMSLHIYKNNIDVKMTDADEEDDGNSRFSIDNDNMDSYSSDFGNLESSK